MDEKKPYACKMYSLTGKITMGKTNVFYVSPTVEMNIFAWNLNYGIV